MDHVIDGNSNTNSTNEYDGLNNLIMEQHLEPDVDEINN